MKGKRLVSLVLAALLLLPACALAAGETEERWSRVEGDGEYVTVRIPYPEGKAMTWSQYRYLMVRYADTGEPVALSGEYRWEGDIFATVPARDAERPLEVVLGEPLKFRDCVTVWEDGESYDAPRGADQLNIRNVIRGDEWEKLNPGQVITRAEAFTILCRLLSLEPEGDPGFADVSPTDWYFAAASAAKAHGLTNEPEFFRPTDPVTRGEFTVMLHRAMQSVGWMGAGEGSAAGLPFADAGRIPGWALAAYTAFGAWDLGISTGQDTGETDEFGAPVQEALAQQDIGAKRGEVIAFVYDALRSLPVYPSGLAIEWGFDREMPVIDGSTSTLPYTNAVYSALFTNSDKHPAHPRKHSKSYYSYDRLISGEADVLFSSTKPTEDTLAKARAAGVELELIPIAHDAMVFFTNAENPMENLTMEQIRAIYVDNAYESWSELGGPEAGLIPYCRNADSGSQAQMEEFFLHGGEIHPDIRRETTAVSMASVLTDVWEAKTDNPPAYALGYSIYYYYQQASWILLPDENTLKLLSVDGVDPTDAAIADGSYPLAGYNYAVVRADAPADSPARRMVEFMTSEAGQQCVVNAGFGALE